MSGGGDNKTGIKGEGGASQGMLSLTREINPALPVELEASLRRWATAAFEAIDGTGAPRIDFYCNEATGEVWLNEVNPCPGSFGYFLWEAADPPIRFTALLSQLIDEAVARHRERQLPRSEEHTSELQSPCNLVCRLLLEKKKNNLIYSACLDSY